jgi:hypothetical protein
MKGLEISFRDIEHSDAIEFQIREKAQLHVRRDHRHSCRCWFTA